MDSQTERRESLRLRPKLDTFVALRPEFSTLGKLLDINRSGLCFLYLTKEAPVDTPEAISIDMFDDTDGYYLPNIPCRMVYDEKSKTDMTYITGLEYRRCGLRFDRLSPEQKEHLERYLKEHTDKGE